MIALTRRKGLTLLGGLAAFGASPVRAQEIDGATVVTYRTRGADLPVVVIPPTTETGPLSGAAVMLLHGAGGLASDIQTFRANARRLTALGCQVVMPSYFSDGQNPAETDDVGWWLTAVTDAAAWTAALPGVDPNRIGALGYSRGGYLAGEAAVQGTTIKAVVGVASAGNVELDRIVRKPEVLLIHARYDPVIPAERTQRWARRLRGQGLMVEVVTMNLERHNFTVAEWQGIFERAETFFVRTLAA